jgi:hypothetical protein
VPTCVSVKDLLRIVQGEYDILNIHMCESDSQTFQYGDRIPLLGNLAEDKGPYRDTLQVLSVNDNRNPTNVVS